MTYDCSYCGEKTKVEMVSGKEACSYCGAGVEDNSGEVFEKTKAKQLEEHTKTIVETTVRTLGPVKTGFERGGRAVRGGPSLFKTMVMFIVVLMVVYASPRIFAAVQEIQDISFTDTTDDITIEVCFHINMFNVTNGELSFYVGNVELHNPSGLYGGQLLQRDYTSNGMVLWSVSVDKDYEIWIYADGMFDGVMQTTFRVDYDSELDFLEDTLVFYV